MERRSEDPNLYKILIVDDHPSVLAGTVLYFRKRYPASEILVSHTANDTLKQIRGHSPDLLLLDLQIPVTEGKDSKTKHGLEILKQIMQQCPQQNIAVMSSYTQSLIRVRSEIDEHQGGFTIIDKILSPHEMLERANASLRGYSDTREIRSLQAIEVKPEWLEVLRLAFNEGLQDRIIAQRLKVTKSTIRHYWKKIYDALGIYPEDERQDGRNLRIRTEILAREKGLLE